MIITCQKCGARYKIKDELAAGGAKRAKCKKCGEPMLIKPPADKPEAAVAVGSVSAPSPEDSAQVPDQSADVTSGSAAETTPQETRGGENTDQATVGSEARTDAPAAAAAPEQGEDAGLETSEPVQSQEKAAEAGEAGSTESENEASRSEAKPARQENDADPVKNQEDIQAKLEKRRREMEDEISGRLNKAALETLDFDILEELANRIKGIEQNTECKPEKDTQLFACIQCKIIFSLFPDDPRLCANCSGDVSLVRGDDILRQFGMFG